ncbi:uncharacterized protein EHS24_007838 [Apiotrichum porosum]|uniref:Transcription factor domain-containing protein n=1 Tax=Apiotrichum porosum TaxID=105984 RepID=A0A427XS84_9TREE|nr:uncharacterized protein EHS24_007838 [Apiotrichum porosum]RSH81658.1 hypothetical protein EHS24_007838 [Apiotrichum porosum]
MTNPPATFRGASPDLLHSVIHSTYRLESAYALWCDSVDPDLNFVHAPPTSALATVLALRGLTLRLLLHRRVMLTGIRDHLGVRSRSTTPTGPATSLKFLEARQREINFGLSIGIIIDTAVFTIRILDSQCSEDLVLSAPWYLLFYSMNSFMSLIATFLLDLTRWATFIRQSGVTIVNSLHMVHGFVRKISNRYRRSSARQALFIIEHLLQALGLSTDPSQGVHTLANVALEGSSSNSNASGQLPQAATSFAEDMFFSNGMGRGLSDLPHLDFEELSKTLGLDSMMPMDFTDFGL